MKKDMDLCRKLLLKIEETGTAIYDLSVENYPKEQVAYHCKILHEAGFLSDYKQLYGDDKLISFGVGALTWAGNEYLDKIRDNTIWGKIKTSINEKGLMLSFEIVKSTVAKMFADAF